MEKIFQKEEIEGKTGTVLQKQTIQIKQRFDQKRNFYHQLRHQPLYFDHWNELHNKIIEFDQEFTKWNQQWANVQRSNNINSIINSFTTAEIFYSEMDDYISDLQVGSSDSDELQAFKKEILESVERDVLNLQANIYSEIEKGINNLVGLKAEMGLEKNFKDNIDVELTNSKKGRKWFFISFIGSVLLIPLTIFFTYKLKLFQTIDVIDLYIIRVGLVLSIGFLSFFLYKQYRLFQIICLRYTHLQGFLGGGATFISQIIGSENTELKQEINKKLAELFMEIELVFGEAQKSSHPAEASLEKTTELLDKISEITKNVTKTN